MTTVREMLRDRIVDAVQQAQQQGVLPPVAIPEVTVETPQNPEHGDYASNIAMRMARTARTDPMSIALALANQMAGSVSFRPSMSHGRVSATSRLSPAWVASQVEEVLAQGSLLRVSPDRQRGDGAARVRQRQPDRAAARRCRARGRTRR